jgi:uncharacterized damage-inducible protein DinB
MTKDTLRPALATLFDLVHTSDDWITPLLKSVDDVTPAQAFWSPSSDGASIAEITAHVIGWLEDLLHDLTGRPASPAGIDWPSIAERTPAAWEALRGRLQTLAIALRSHLRSLSEERLLEATSEEDVPRWQRIGSIFVHNAYHAGQIVKLRQIYRSRERNGSEAVLVLGNS